MSIPKQVKDVFDALTNFVRAWTTSDAIRSGQWAIIVETLQFQQTQLDALTKAETANAALLQRILAAVEAPVAVGFVVELKYADTGAILNPNGETQMNVIVGKQVIATISKIEDKFGNDATLDGLPAWGSSGDAVASVTPAPDGMSAVIVFSTTAKLQGQVTLTGDGDPGPDQALFHSNLDFTTIADVAVDFQVSVSAPTDPTVSATTASAKKPS